MNSILRIFLFIFLLVLLSKSANAQSFGGTTSGATTYCSTTNAGFVSVSGFTGTILNWQSSTDGGVTWNPIANITANQTYFNLAQTTCYQAVVQNGAFPPDTSTTVCITIFPPSVGGTLSGGGTFCGGSGPGTLTLTGYNGNILYWQSSTDGGSTWTTIPNTTPTENYINITTSTLYWVVVQNGPSCPTDTSTQISFTINPTTVPGTVGGSASVCASGNAGILNLSGHTGSVLSWSYSTTSGATWISIPNITAAQSYLNLTTTTWYHAIVQSAGCGVDSSSNAIITVSPATVGGTVSGGGSFCGVPATGVLTLSGYTGNITGWISSTTSGASWTPISNTTPTENYTALAVTTWYAAILQSGGCPIDTSTIEIVSVFPMTVAGSISGSTTVCAGTNSGSVSLTGNVGGVIGWLSSIDGGITWVPVANTTTTLLYSGLTQTTWYTAIVQSGTCSIDTATAATITVLVPFPVSAGNDTTINAGQSVLLSGTGSGTPLWSPGTSLDNPAVFNPLATPLTTTTYVLTVMDVNGCLNTDDVTITIVPLAFNGMVTNLFTPNGDGINDAWYIEGIANFPDNEVFVYNIYGMEVFSKKGYTNDWQGTYSGGELPDGTYFYVLRFDGAEGIIKGSIDILRK
ncbi:MAG: gliding motility-associated C-terminal domain-containing protein [Bacteroidota bacterium]|nr:gliding motility-associated C-terminal domain-containing protein [Bacteroidota bacterium]